MSNDALEAEVILSFLDHLEEHRHNSARSSNIRLAAIQTFFRWVALREPEQIGLATQVLAADLRQRRAGTMLAKHDAASRTSAARRS